MLHSYADTLNAIEKETTIDIIEIVLMGVALSADAMSVTICNMMANPRMSRAKALSMPIAFGIFQGLMPLLGYFASSFATSFIETYSGIISLIILGIIGGKMIWDGVHDDGSEEGATNLGAGVLVMQAIATSIDAFAVGISLLGSGAPIFLDSAIIAVCTFALCLAMLAVGRRFGSMFGARAQIVGGIILVIIGLKAMFS